MWWEYVVDDLSHETAPYRIQQSLDFRGESGWELVAVCGGLHYYKRVKRKL